MYLYRSHSTSTSLGKRDLEDKKVKKMTQEGRRTAKK